MRFEPNLGQTGRRAQFLARGAGYVVYLTPGEAVLKLRTPKTRDFRVVRLRWVGGAGGSDAQGLDEMASKSHHFVGSDPEKWRRNVPNYRRVRYRDVYRGVDMVFRGTEGRLECDREVAPGANPGRIRLAVSGVDRTE